jgi:Ca2+-binding RTX toxin-like protein
MDSIDCGPGVDRVIVNRGDLTFNCEQITRLHGRRVPGLLWEGSDIDDIWDRWQGHNRDLLVGKGGDDYLKGHGAADMLWGNEGKDTLDGDLSPDQIFGGPGDDRLIGFTGLDRLWGGAGLDRFFGGPDNDELISITADGVADVLDCGPGRDRAVARPEDTVLANCERVIRVSG